jgi:hypothetical protein
MGLSVALGSFAAEDVATRPVAGERRHGPLPQRFCRHSWMQRPPVALKTRVVRDGDAGTSANASASASWLAAYVKGLRIAERDRGLAGPG